MEAKFSYKCGTCGTTHPYTYTEAQVTKRGAVAACIWGGCSGQASKVRVSEPACVTTATVTA